jgi:hypothetical protein
MILSGTKVLLNSVQFTINDSITSTQEHVAGHLINELTKPTPCMTPSQDVDSYKMSCLLWKQRLINVFTAAVCTASK